MFIPCFSDIRYPFCSLKAQYVLENIVFAELCERGSELAQLSEPQLFQELEKSIGEPETAAAMPSGDDWKGQMRAVLRMEIQNIASFLKALSSKTLPIQALLRPNADAIIKAASEDPTFLPFLHEKCTALSNLLTNEGTK